jgi:hypothetical protein
MPLHAAIIFALPAIKFVGGSIAAMGVAKLVYDENYPVIQFDKRIRLHDSDADPSRKENTSTVEILTSDMLIRPFSFTDKKLTLIVAVVRKSKDDKAWRLNVYTHRGEYVGTLWSITEQFRSSGQPMFPEDRSWLENTVEPAPLKMIERFLSFQESPEVTSRDTIDFSRPILTEDGNAVHYIGRLPRPGQDPLNICLVDIKWIAEKRAYFETYREEMLEQIVNAYYPDGTFFGTVIFKGESTEAGKELATPEYASDKDYSSLVYGDLEA